MLAGRTSFATPVGAVMTPRRELRALTPRDSVVLAMQLMVAHDIRNVPVVREGGGEGVLKIRIFGPWVGRRLEGGSGKGERLSRRAGRLPTAVFRAN